MVDGSPSVRNLVKNFEHIHKVSPRTPPPVPQRWNRQPRSSPRLSANSKHASSRLIERGSFQVEKSDFRTILSNNTCVSDENFSLSRTRMNIVKKEETKEEEDAPTPPNSVEIVPVGESMRRRWERQDHEIIKEDEKNKEDESISKILAGRSVSEMEKKRRMLIAGLKEQLSASKMPSAAKNRTEEASRQKTPSKSSDQTFLNRIDGNNDGDKRNGQHKTPIVSRGHYPLELIEDEQKNDEIPARDSTDSDEVSSSVGVESIIKNEIQKKGASITPKNADEGVFTISRTSINSMETPIRSPRNQNGTSFMNSIVKHCRSVPSKFTPMRKNKQDRLSEPRAYKVSVQQPTEVFDPKFQIDEESGTDTRTMKSDKQRCFRSKKLFLKQNMERCGQSTKNVVSAIIVKGKEIAHELKPRIQLAAQNTMNKIRKVPSAARISAKCIVDVQQECMLCYLSLLISMATNIYPTVPRCNVAVSSMMLFYNSIAATDKGQQNSSFYRCIIVMYLFSIILDIDWLLSDYYPIPMDLNAEQFIYNTQHGASLIRKISWTLIILGIFIKIICLAAMLRKSSIGSNMMSDLWKKVHLFFPSFSVKETANAAKVLESRIIALIWVEFVGSLVLLILTLYSQARLSWSPQFQLKPVLTTIQNIFYAKALSGIILVAAIARNCRKCAILTEFGCLSSSWNGDVSNVHALKVIVNGPFLKFNGSLKAINIVLGAFVWYSIMSAFSLAGGDTPKEVKVVLGGALFSMMMTDILAVTLCITIGCYAYVSKYQEIMTNNYGAQNGEEANDALSSRSEISSITNDLVSFTLDDNVAYEPLQFSLEWKMLSPGIEVEYRANRTPPSLSECNSNFQEHCFFPVASGVVNNGNLMKIFLIARSSIGGSNHNSTHSTTDKDHTTQCLVKLTFEPTHMRLKLHAKLSNHRYESRIKSQAESVSMITKFIKKLPLLELFGASKVVKEHDGNPLVRQTGGLFSKKNTRSKLYHS